MFVQIQVQLRSEAEASELFREVYPSLDYHVAVDRAVTKVFVEPLLLGPRQQSWHNVVVSFCKQKLKG